MALGRGHLVAVEVARIFRHLDRAPLPWAYRITKPKPDLKRSNFSRPRSIVFVNNNFLFASVNRIGRSSRKNNLYEIALELRSLMR